VTDSILASVSASGPGEAWAVGTFANADALDAPLVEHWNGTAWSIVPTPDITADGDASQLTGVSADGAGDVQASGYADDDGTNLYLVFSG